MKFIYWYLTLAFSLAAFSVITYLAQIHIFEKTELTFFYIFQDLAFVPIEVLIVTLILDKLLKRREKMALLNKLNMVIGVFYNEVGLDLIKYFGKATVDFERIEDTLNITSSWNEKEYSEARKNFIVSPGSIIFDIDNMNALREFLCTKRDDLLNLLANPNLLEHESFTDLLWAVFHLCDELYMRESLGDLPKSDQDHIKGDLIRAYKFIVYEWLSYMKHLRNDYPYLYSIAVRTNPFNPEASIIVE